MSPLDSARLDLARHLNTIGDLTTLASAALVEQSRDSEDGTRLMGGDLLSAVGPCAPLDEWEALLDAAEEVDEGAYAADQDGEDWHVLTVLERWTHIIREERDQPTDLKATVSRETDYLRKAIQWCTRPDAHGEPEWMEVFDLVDDLARLRHRLEQLLHLARHETRGVPCLDCGVPLRRLWAAGAGKRAADDHWQCDKCRRVVSHDAYMLAVQADYLASSPWLEAGQIETQWGVGAALVRQWASRGKVKTRLNVETRRVQYHVADVRGVSQFGGRSVS